MIPIMVAHKSWRFVRIAVGNYLSLLKVHMFSQTITKPHSSEIFSQSQNNTWEIEGEKMYAIAFDMDIESLKITYGDPYNFPLVCCIGARYSDAAN